MPFKLGDSESLHQDLVLVPKNARSKWTLHADSCFRLAPADRKLSQPLPRVDLTARHRRENRLKSVAITQTSFLDFCTATPRGKVGVVREVKQRYEQDYKDWRDAYRPVREGIKTLHRKGKERHELAKLIGK